MPLEPDVDNIDDLVQSNPIVTDDVNEGDNHLRIIKRALQGNVSGDDLTTSLLAAGIPMFRVDGVGAAVFRVELNGSPALLFLQDGGAVEVARIQANDAGNLVIQHSKDNRGVNLAGSVGAPGDTLLFTGDPLGEAVLFNLGNGVLVAAANGGEVRSSDGIISSSIRLANDDGSVLWGNLFASGGGGMTLSAEVNGSLLTLRGRTGAGGITTFATFQAEGQSIIFAEGVARITATGVGATIAGQATVTSAAPSAVNHLTRKDYVDNQLAALNVSSNPAQRVMRIGDVQMIGGTQTAIGQAVTVVFAVPFTAIPSVSNALQQAGAANNGFCFINTVTNTGWTGVAGIAATQIHWTAIGTNAA